MLEGCTSLTAATLVEGVTETPEGLFKGCTSLSKVGLPSTLTRLGDYTFYECKALKNNEWTSIIMPGQTTTDGMAKEAGNLLEIGAYAFAYSGIVRIKIPASTNIIGNDAFAYCVDLAEIIFENTTLGEEMLLGCTGLEHLTLPEGITSIDAGAFADCVKLISVKLPTTLTSIGKGAFSGCMSIEIMELPFIGQAKGTSVGEEALLGWIFSTTTNTDAINGVNGKKPMVNVSQIYSLNGEKSTVDYYIPAGLTSLRIYGESVIGYGAFSDITSLTNLVINDNDITAIGDYAFYNCSHLTNLVYTNDDYEIVNHVMTIKSKDYNINLMPGIITIGNYAFYGCSNIESIRMEGNVTTIGDYAFAKCTTLARINNTLDSARATILADKTYT